ncbi:VOC family protein [Sandarakinorhabdus oryzae]|uniref:VOC family protein n=1 Tax=Sandarakinorhabdus oryzae TaxID=2675220 RepID=UPI0012E26524|nr:VOC family protein [Sandarakinorhabdus oryzae]
MTSTSIAAATLGIHHVGLAVPDLDTASTFFISALGFAEVGAVPSYPARFVSDGTTLITLWQTDAAPSPFDRRGNVGLHHLAFRVADDAALNVLHTRLASWAGVAIEVAPCPIREGSAVRHFIIAMPGGIRIEFATPFPG